MLICEMAAYYRQQGMSLDEVMTEIYEEYGYYLNRTDSYEFDGAAGMEKMAYIMENFRKNPPTEVAGYKVTEIADYLNSYQKDIATGEQTEINLPKSNVLSYSLEGGMGVIVRPSGTEPKVKVYITSVGISKDNAAEIAEKMAKYMANFMK